MDVVLALQIGHTTSNLLKMFVLLLLMIINMMRILDIGICWYCHIDDGDLAEDNDGNLMMMEIHLY